MKKSDLARLAKLENRLYEMAREEGLNFCDIEWDIIPDQKMFEIMAYRIPGNISNWKYGRDYERIRTINEKVYDGLPLEVVINSDPSRAYLMKSNTIGQQILVMAHVIGHVSFFTMNKYFQKTRKDIIQILDYANKRFTKYEQSYGLDELEMIVDAGHALQLHSSPFDTELEIIKKARVFEMERRRDNKLSKSKYADVMGDDPVDKITTDVNLYNMKLKRMIDQKTPIEPAADLLRYIIDHSKCLEDWQKDVLEILRAEGQYFWPQIKTKYMNEGFATYWHERLGKRLYEESLITNLEYAEFNYSNSLVKASHKTAMNPYLIGCQIWESIVDRWDKGQHGKDFEYEEDFEKKDKWNTKSKGEGNKKMFSVLETYTDWFFVQDFLTPQLVNDLNLYVYVVKDNYQTIDVIRTKHDAQQVRDLIVGSFAHSHIPQV
jgi:stage V sporulation protein R